MNGFVERNRDTLPSETRSLMVTRCVCGRWVVVIWMCTLDMDCNGGIIKDSTSTTPFMACIAKYQGPSIYHAHIVHDQSSLIRKESYDLCSASGSGEPVLVPPIIPYILIMATIPPFSIIVRVF